MNMTKQYVNKYMNQTSQFDHTMGRKDVKQTLFSGLALLGAALFFCLSQLASAATVSGYIYANGVIQNDSGAPFWVEYDAETGERIESTLRAAEGDLALDKVYQMAGDTYREYGALFQSLQALYPNSSVIKLPIADFQAAQFVDANGNALSKVKSFVDADKARFVVIAPPLSTANGAYQYYRAEDVVLAQMPIDPETWVSARSLLIEKTTGAIHYQTDNNLGYATAFFSKPGEYVQSENLFRGREDTIWNPIREAKVTEISYGGFSDRSGRYSVELERVYCLPTGNTAGLTAELSFQSFNPRNRTGMYPYYLYKEVPRPCFTMNFIHVGFGMGLWTLGTVYTPPQQYFDFQVDFSVLNGRASIGNEAVQGGTVAVVDDAQDTTYASSASLSEQVSATDKGVTYDFDRDGIPDQIHLGRVEEDAESGEETFNTQVTIEEDNVVQGVYLSSLGHTPPALPDITRQLDDSLSLEHEGLLQTITEKDLKNTDVYLFRVSTGELIAERTGATLSESDHSYQGTGVSDGTFHYTLHIRGKQQGKHKRTGFSSSRTDAEYQPVSRDEAFAAWQAESGVNPALHERESDHLRPGEPVKIIAINRATGYMGSVTTVLDGQDDEGEEEALRSAMAVISKMVKEIQMGPPNLKIWADRTYNIESGLTATNSPITQTIGNEGAALNSDDTVVLHTQWLDRDGSPLPEALAEYGFTGRVARVVGENQVSTLSGIDATFAIAPGTHLEFIQISGLSNSNDHIYVQVSGEPKSRAPSFATDALTPEELSTADKFATSGNIHSGRLRYRPDHYVPFLTKVWDEASSSALELAFNQVKLTNPDSPLSKPDPVYQWLYRPDFQYSVYDFKVAELNRVENGEPQNILQTDTPTITSSDDLLQLIYSLVGSAYDTLDGFSFSGDKDQQLIFALGETEIRATVGSNQQVNFEDLSQLSALDSEDFLSLRLYSNNDARNVLWEFAFLNVSLFPPLDIGATPHEISVDDSDTYAISGVVNNGKIEEGLRVAWTSNDNTSFSPALDFVTTRDFYTGVSLPKVAGAVVSLRASTSDGNEIASHPVKMIAGQPATVLVSQSGKTAIGGIGKISVTAQVSDQYGNPVADGTSVTLHGSDIVGDSVQLTQNGIATFMISGSQAAGDQLIKVAAGRTVAESTITVHDITLNLSVPAEVPVGQKAVATVSATTTYGSLLGEKIHISSVRGGLPENWLTLDGNNSASINMDVGDFRGEGAFYAALSDKITFKSFEVVENSDAYLLDNVVVEDGSGTGEFSAGGVTYQYTDQTTLVVNGTPGAQANVSLIDYLEPPMLPELHFSMQSPPTPSGLTNDSIVGLAANVQGVALTSTPLGISPWAYKFAENSQLSIQYDYLASRSNLGFVFLLNLAEDAQEGSVIDHPASGISLRINSSNELIFQRETSAGTQELKSSPLQDSWHTIGAHVVGGRLVLQVDDEIYKDETVLTGSIASTDNDLIVGQNLQGNLAQLKIYDWDSEKLLELPNGELEDSLTIGANGKGTLTIRSKSSSAFAHIERQRLRSRSEQLSIPLIEVAYAQTQECDAPHVGDSDTFDFGAKLDQAESYMRFLAECQHLPNIKKNFVTITSEGNKWKKPLAAVKLAYYTDAYIRAKASELAFAVGPECAQGILIGDPTTLAAGTCDFITSLLLVGDLRDFAFHSFWLFTGEVLDSEAGQAKYDKATYIFASIGIITTLAEVTGVGIVVDAAVAGCKTVAKIFKGNTYILSLALRAEKEILENWKDSTKLKAGFNLMLPSMQVTAMAVLMKDEFADAWRIISEIKPHQLEGWMRYAKHSFDNVAGQIVMERTPQPLFEVENAYAAFTIIDIKRFIDENGAIEGFIGALQATAARLDGLNLGDKTYFAQAINEGISTLGKNLDKIDQEDVIQALTKSDVLSAFAVAYDVGRKMGATDELMDAIIRFRCLPSTCHALKVLRDAATGPNPGPEAIEKFFGKLVDAAQLRNAGKMTDEAYEDLNKVISQLGKVSSDGTAPVMAVQRGAAHVIQSLEEVAQKIATQVSGTGDNYKILRFEDKTPIGEAGKLGDRIYDFTIEVDGKVFQVEMKSWDPAMFDEYMEGSLKGLKREGDEGKLPGQMSKDLVDALQQVQLRFDGNGLVINQELLDSMTKRWAFDSRMAESGRTADSLTNDVLEILADEPSLWKGLLTRAGVNSSDLDATRFDDAANSLREIMRRIFIL